MKYIRAITLGPCYLSGPLRFYGMNSVDLATGRCAVTPVFNKAAQSAIDSKDEMRFFS